ncbi:hypothetical protein RZS08_32740, partial [Arthrospira platensis SPKY1]|nr:hypothetical protein [Arthrospira platensis SPKY1]
HIGDHPIIPDLVQRALRSAQYSATLYMRPGLLHFELGWPNHLRWRDKFGPLVVDCNGGIVFRVQDGQLLLGISFAANGTLELSAQVGGSNFGASISALSEVAFIARIIAVIDARDVRGSMFYGLVALDLLVQFAVAAWLYIKVFRRRIGTTIRFSFSLQVTVA